MAEPAPEQAIGEDVDRREHPPDEDPVVRRGLDRCERQGTEIGHVGQHVQPDDEPRPEMDLEQGPAKPGRQGRHCDQAAPGGSGRPVARESSTVSGSGQGWFKACSSSDPGKVLSMALPVAV